MAAPRPLDARNLLAPRLLAAALLIGAWQALALSGLFFRDVIPPVPAVLGALARVLGEAGFYANLRVTAVEFLAAMAVGGVVGTAVGLVLGGSRFLARAYEAWLHYLGPTPKIIFFPIMIMWFGVGPGSKMAMGALSCFFPVAISVAAGMRGIDPVLLRVGRSFRASPWQMVRKIHLPAMRAPLINGFRLGFGVAAIGILLAETKLSKEGIGFLIIQSYTRFDMPRMYSLLILTVALVAIVNAVISRLAQPAPLRRD